MLVGTLNILVLIPGISKEHNDNASLFVHLAKNDNKICVIAGRSLALKGSGYLPEREEWDGVQIYRPYRDLYDAFRFPGKLISLTNVIREFRPHVIFCMQEMNMRSAIIARKLLGKSIPVVLLVEDAGRIASGEYYASLKARMALIAMLRVTKGHGFWNWLQGHTDAIITCQPNDVVNLNRLTRQVKVVFLPWCSELPSEFSPSQEKVRRGIYVGSLHPKKNTAEFKQTIPEILENSPTDEFVVIGRGQDARIIEELRERFEDRLVHIPGVTRLDALRLISSSSYGYSPAKPPIGAWGFTLDCWGVGTPLIVTHYDGYVEPMRNAILSSPPDVSDAVNGLLSNSELSRRLVMNGLETYRGHSPKIVATALNQIFQQVVSDPIRK